MSHIILIGNVSLIERATTDNVTQGRHAMLKIIQEEHTGKNLQQHVSDDLASYRIKRGLIDRAQSYLLIGEVQHSMECLKRYVRILAHQNKEVIYLIRQEIGQSNTEQKMVSPDLLIFWIGRPIEERLIQEVKKRLTSLDSLEIREFPSKNQFKNYFGYPLYSLDPSDTEEDQAALGKILLLSIFNLFEKYLPYQGVLALQSLKIEMILQNMSSPLIHSWLDMLTQIDLSSEIKRNSQNFLEKLYLNFFCQKTIDWVNNHPQTTEIKKVMIALAPYII